MSDETPVENTDSGPFGWGWDADGKPHADKMPQRFKDAATEAASKDTQETHEGTKQ